MLGARLPRPPATPQREHGLRLVRPTRDAGSCSHPPALPARSGAQRDFQDDAGVVLLVRIVIHTGDAPVGDGGLDGQAVVKAADLRPNPASQDDLTRASSRSKASRSPLCSPSDL